MEERIDLEIRAGELSVGGQMDATIRRAVPIDLQTVVEVLREAASWLEEKGIPMWRLDELEERPAAEAIARGEFRIAELGQGVAGVMRFQLEDRMFWPDQPEGNAAYIHRLAVRRFAAGKGISGALIRSAEMEARALGRQYLRLDTEASRKKLCGLYLRHGFREHSQVRVGPYDVMRFEKRL